MDKQTKHRGLDVLHALVLADNGRWMYFDDMKATPQFIDPFRAWPRGFVEALFFYRASERSAQINIAEIEAELRTRRTRLPDVPPDPHIEPREQSSLPGTKLRHILAEDDDDEVTAAVSKRPMSPQDDQTESKRLRLDYRKIIPTFDRLPKLATVLLSGKASASEADLAKPTATIFKYMNSTLYRWGITITPSLLIRINIRDG